MTEQRAKQIAADRIATAVQSELDVGGYASDPEVETQKDEEKLRRALIKLRDRLQKEAGW
jgi:hypothetical protein